MLVTRSDFLARARGGCLAGISPGYLEGATRLDLQTQEARWEA